MNVTADLSVDYGTLTDREQALARERRKQTRATVGYTTARRQVEQHAAKERARVTSQGFWPGYAAAVQDHEHPGRWIAVILLNRGESRYVRRQSVARFTTSDDAYDAAERWLRRELEPR